MLPRIIFTLLLIIGVSLVPWWLVLLLSVVGITVWPWFLEAVMVALWIDVVFAAGAWPLATTVVLILLLVVEGVRYYSFY